MIYMLEEGAAHTFVPLTTPDKYVDRLLQNPSVGPHIVDHDVRIKKLLSNVDNPIAEELVIDYDLVEVMIWLIS